MARKEAAAKQQRKCPAKRVTNRQKPAANEQPLRVVVELVPNRLAVEQAIKYLMTAPRETNGTPDAVPGGEDPSPQ